jgi:hypothetical protein
MDQLVAEVKRLAVNADEQARRQIMDSLHNVAYSIETPQDTIQRIMYSVRVPSRVIQRLQAWGLIDIARIFQSLLLVLELI